MTRDSGDACPLCGRPEQEGNPRGSEACPACGKGIHPPQMTLARIIERLRDLHTALFPE